MSTIKYHIADIGGQLSQLKGLIESAFARFVTIVVDDLSAETIEITFVPAPGKAIPQLGIGGHSPGPNNILVYFDPKSDKINQDEILATLLHESHHCMRWRSTGYGKSLGQAMVSEGLASLYEQEHLGRAPIHVTASLKDNQVKRAVQSFDRQDYDHNEWFFDRGSLDFWFGYALGYQLCRQYSEKTGQTAAQLVNTPASEILAKAVLASCAEASDPVVASD